MKMMTIWEEFDYLQKENEKLLDEMHSDFQAILDGFKGGSNEEEKPIYEAVHYERHEG